MENFSKLFEDENKTERAQQAEHERQVNELYSEIGRLTTQLNWLKKNLATTSRAERLAMIEPALSELSLKAQAELLGISRSSLYYTTHYHLPRKRWRSSTASMKSIPTGRFTARGPLQWY